MPKTGHRPSPRIAPSILTADLGNLAAEIRRVSDAGADYVHLDVMDGRFVPNISIGLPVVESVRQVTTLPLDIHLMIVEPERYIARFADAGADLITVQVEACRHVHRTLQQIRELGCQAGLALNPGTSVSAIEEVLGLVDVVLVMSVNPGFGGQSFISTSLQKIERVRALLDSANPEAFIEVDGGIKPENAREIWQAGADILVAGSAIFSRERTVTESIDAFRAAIPLN
ncbi:MAG TPA: ribulose-phosphate 3-epimerase [Nitrolancea sp.]|jgi:ribulose-phosphate 3-epimerase|nr:ribulose-phosphate 3-epimerase [Nitrolancea sp.]